MSLERRRNFWRKTTRRGHRDQQDWILIGFLELYIVRIGLPNAAKLSGGRSSYAFIAVISVNHSRSFSFPTIITFISLAALRPLIIQASVTAPKERTPTLQNRQEQSPRDLMVIDSPNNPATSLLVQAATDQWIFKQGEKHALPLKTTVSLQRQHRDKRHTNEEFVARACSGS